MLRSNKFKIFFYLYFLVFSKILYQGDNSFVYYVCSQRTLDGRCSIDGVQAFVYTRNQTMTDNTEEQVNKALKLAHINPSDLVITEGMYL